jgi:hypothetical protein
MDSPQTIFARYLDLRRYIGWTREDEDRVLAAGKIVAPHFDDLVEDF